MEAAVFYVNGIKIYQFNVKDSEIVAYHMCLGNISKDFTNDNIKKIKWVCVQFFSQLQCC